MPERLSLASDGWQTCVVSSTSSSRSPGRTHSPYVSDPGSSVLSTTTSYSPSLERVELASARGRSPRSACSTRSGTGSSRARSACVCRCGRSSSSDHRRANGLAVADDVEVRLAEVDDPLARRRRDVGVADVPLVRHRPVEHLRPARHLVDLERDPLADRRSVCAHAVAGDAATDREELAP